MPSQPLIFYDIPSLRGPWSPNTWKTRYVLNIKSIEYITEWVEFQDIPTLAKKIGAPPTAFKDDGSPVYTVPIIKDPNTDKVISDSFIIAEYLDTTYPDEITLFPRGTKPLMAAFENGVIGAISPLVPALLASIYDVLNPRSQEYFKATREARFGKKIEEFSPVGPERDAHLEKGKEALAAVEKWLAKSEGEFVLGAKVSYADCILAAWFVWIKVTDGIWKDVATWNNGLWPTCVEKASYPPSCCIRSAYASLD